MSEAAPKKSVIHMTTEVLIVGEEEDYSVALDENALPEFTLTLEESTLQAVRTLRRDTGSGLFSSIR